MTTAPTTSSPWEIRAIQLDLARQRETVETICEFARFAADWGFNTLFLYLEGAVRTPSFPWRDPALSYTPDDMRRVVDCAGECGIEVVPGLATLGHAEHFLTCPELQHLAAAANFGGPMFNPSIEATYEFLAGYMAEIADIFPSGHLHIGCDEAWRLGRSPEDRQRRAAGETYADLLIGHLERVAGLAQALGRRAWIWDDLLEYLTDDEISRLRRDMVMCNWNYNRAHIDLDGVRGHFNNIAKRNWLGLFSRLGFDVLVCPGAAASHATGRYTEYGRQYPVLGGLQTIWELANTFLPALLPQVAITGRLWSRPELSFGRAQQQALEELFPSLGEAERLAVLALIGDLEGEDVRPTPASLCERLLRGRADQAQSQLEADIIEDLHVRAKADVVRRTWTGLRDELIDPRVSRPSRREQDATINFCRRSFDELAADRARQWQKLRPGIEPEGASQQFHNARKTMDAFLDEHDEDSLGERALLELWLFLWEGYSAPQLKAELRIGESWREVFSGMRKPTDLEASRYRFRIPVRLGSGQQPPSALRLTVSGFGGQGVSFASLLTASAALTPGEVIESNGQALTPEAILTDNPFVCWLGSTDTVETLMAATEDETASVAITLRRSG